MHEKRMHQRSCFVTLTYSNEFLPPGGSLVKRDLQLFMKRLRKEHGEGIRFYACGEYGEKNMRPHYHVLLFNHDFGDRLIAGANRRGDKWYTSKALEKLWTIDDKLVGHCLLGEVTFDSAAYVARYIVSKITGDRARTHYQVVDGDGVLYDRLPEFTVMSRRPGIGSGYYEKYGSEVRNQDSVVINGRCVRPPRFYDTRFDVVDPAGLASVKVKRRKAARLFRDDNTVDRRRVREQVTLLNLKRKERSL